MNDTASHPASSLPVAASWYRRTHVGDGVSLITEPHVAPLLRCNLWLVEGRDRSVMIDAGLGLVALRPFLHVDERKPVTLVATHAHRDHIGAAHEFDDVYAHPREAEAIEQARDDLPLDITQWSPGLLERLERQGYECRCGMLAALPYAGYSPAAVRLKPATVTRLIDEGDVIHLGNRSLEVLHLPGHSPGSIGLYDRASGALFSGDAIYDGPLLDDIEGADRTHYRETMERLLKLPVSAVHAGHGPDFGAARLRAIALSYLERPRVKS